MQMGAERLPSGEASVPARSRRDCGILDEVGTDKVRWLMDGRSREVDERMDEGEGEGAASLTQANGDRQRGMTCWSIQPRKAPLQFTRC